MPFVCHATVSDGERVIERGERVSDADGNRLSLEHAGVFTRVAFDPDLDGAPAPDPKPAAAKAPSAPSEVNA